MLPRRMGLYGMCRATGVHRDGQHHTPPHTSVTWPAHGPRKCSIDVTGRASAERCCGQI